MKISVTEPIEHAMEWMKVVCFRPFDMGKWFTMGFCAFLAALGEGGGFRGNFNMRGFGQRRGPGGPDLQRAVDWVSANLVLLALIVVGVSIVGLAISAVLQWVSSRGKFMLLDGVARNQAAVVEPWRRLRPFGNSLFFVLFGLTVIGAIVSLVVVVGCFGLAWPDITAHQFGTSALTAIIVAGCVLVPFGLAMGVIKTLLNDFVAPIMYRKGLPAMAAAGVLRQQVLRGHVGVFILYLLMKFSLAISAVAIILVGTCLTCCIAGLPYLSSVVFLPVAVFFRAYSLYFLGQFGPDWQVLPSPYLPPGSVSGPVQGTPAP